MQRAYKIRSAPEATRVSPPNIILIEDDEDMLSYITSILEDEGYVVLAALSAEMGKQLIETEISDLVICDIIMPGMDGYTFLTEIRGKGMGLPFLFLTGKTEKEYLLRALELGADGYITKPFDNDELLARVKNVVHNYKMRVSKPCSNLAVIVKEAAPTESYQQGWLKKLDQYVLSAIGNSEIKVPELATKLTVSERTLRTRVRAYTGLSPNQHIMNLRLELASKYIKEERYPTVAEVAFAVGIKSSSYFSSLFKSRFGISPTAFQQKSCNIPQDV